RGLVGRRGLDLDPRSGSALQRAARPRLPFDRLRAVHAGRRAGRGRAGGPLVVGGRRRPRGRDPLRPANRPDGPDPAAGRCGRPLRRATIGRYRVIATAERSGISHLAEIESEAIHIFREAAAVFERPALLFSGGKDSIVLLRLAEKAFRPGGFPFPIVHVDTGHNFPEVLDFRDRRVAELGERLFVASVQESIERGRVVEETGPRASRNRLQTTTLLD